MENKFSLTISYVPPFCSHGFCLTSLDGQALFREAVLLLTIITTNRTLTLPTPAGWSLADAPLFDPVATLYLYVGNFLNSQNIFGYHVNLFFSNKLSMTKCFEVSLMGYSAFNFKEYGFTLFKNCF